MDVFVSFPLMTQLRALHREPGLEMENSFDNVSRHLAPHNIVVRESLGTLLCWRLGDESIYGLSDRVCGSMDKQYGK